MLPTVCWQDRKRAAAALELQALRPRDHCPTPADAAKNAAADLAAYFDQPANYAHAAALAEVSA